MKLSVKSYSYILFLIALYLPILPILAGTYFINPDNYLDKGFTVTPTISSTPALVIGTGPPKNFSTASGSMVISGISIKSGFSWREIAVDITGGNITMSIQDAGGNILLNNSTLTSSTLLDLKSTEAAKQGRALTITIDFTGGGKLRSLKITYDGQGVIAYPSPFVISEGNLSISYDLANTASVTLIIYDARGRLVKTIYQNQVVDSRTSPKQSDKWNGRNERGNKVASGVYIVMVSVNYLNQNNVTAGGYQSTFRFVVLR